MDRGAKSIKSFSKVGRGMPSSVGAYLALECKSFEHKCVGAARTIGTMTGLKESIQLHSASTPSFTLS